MASSLLVRIKNSCSRLHCQREFDLIPLSYKFSNRVLGCRVRARGQERLDLLETAELRGNNFEISQDILPESQGQILALTVLDVPDSGLDCLICARFWL